MSITRLQQARQMYALGKLVERVGFQGGGMDMGSQSNQEQSAGMGGGNDDNNKGSDRPEITRPNPHRDSGYSKTSVATGDEISSAARDFAQDINNKRAIEAAITGKKFNPYTGGAGFAPTRKGPSLLDIALFAAGPLGLFGKTGKTISTIANLGKRAKTGVETITSIADQFDFQNPIGDMFSGNNESTSKNNTNDGGGDGEGLASLENQAGSYDEYILLLQKLQSGNISDSEQNRFSVLKNMLGI